MEELIAGFSLLNPLNWSLGFLALTISILSGCTVGDIIGEILYPRRGGITKTRMTVWLVLGLICIYGAGRISLMAAGVS